MKKVGTFDLPLRGLSHDTQRFEYVLNEAFFTEMESDFVVGGSVNVELTVTNRVDFLELDFVLKGTVKIPCDRCLDPMNHEVDTIYHVTVKSGKEFNDETDGLIIVPDDMTHLNVASMLYDTVVLTIPIQHMHPEGECNQEMIAQLEKHAAHLANSDEDSVNLADFSQDVSQAGTTRDDMAHIDPRWAKLSELLNNN